MPAKKRSSPQSTQNASPVSRSTEIKKRQVGATNRNKLVSHQKEFASKTSTSKTSKLTAKQVETIRQIHDQELKAEKTRRIIIIVIIAILAVAFIVVAIVLAFLYLGQEVAKSSSTPSESTYSSTQISTVTPLPPLQNLTEDCFKIKPYYYHKYQYPDNCMNTVCESLQFKLTKWLEFNIFYQDTANIPVKEGTICGEGKSCQNGKCENTTDPRAKIVNKKQSIEGWRHTCHNPVQFSGDQTLLEKLKDHSYCPPNSSRTCKPMDSVDIISIHFLSCNDPLPTPLGTSRNPKDGARPDCFTLTAQPPFFINKVCEVCPNKTEPPSFPPNCFGGPCLWQCPKDKFHQMPFGTPCAVGKINWDKYPMYCVYDDCLPVYSSSPHTLNIPRAKCDDD